MCSTLTAASYRLDLKENSIVQHYILPDLSINKRGRIKGPGEILSDVDQVLVMNNERFSVPELIFRPDDIGRYPKRCSTFLFTDLFGNTPSF